MELLRGRRESLGTRLDPTGHTRDSGNLDASIHRSADPTGHTGDSGNLDASLSCSAGPTGGNLDASLLVCYIHLSV